MRTLYYWLWNVSYHYTMCSSKEPVASSTTDLENVCFLEAVLPEKKTLVQFYQSGKR
jgi:hypothetical protein